MTKSNFKLYLGLLLILSVFQSCKTSQNLSKTPDKMSASELISYLNNNQVIPEWFNGKAKISFDHPDMSMSFSSTIKMRKDSIVWANGKKLGLEAGRILVNRDSAFVLDRINNDYIVEGLDYMERHSLPGDFNALQQFVLGNPLLPMTASFKVEKAPSAYHIFGSHQGIDIDYYFSKKSLLLQKVIVTQKGKDKKLEFSLEEYAMLDDKVNFPYLRNIKMKDGKENTTVQIKFTKVEIDVPQEFKFVVPGKYTGE
jgi:hypothetical protein